MSEITEIAQRVEKLKASPSLQVFASHVARDYITLLERIEHLQDENEMLRAIWQRVPSSDSTRGNN